MNQLPTSRQQIISFFSSKLTSKRAKYCLGIGLDLICLSLIIINGIQPAARLISPLVTPLINQASSQVRVTNESFSFAPGSAQNKFSRVELRNLNTLAFFDVPLANDGTINTDSRGYASFHSQAAADLFAQAHQAGSKVVVTITQTNHEALVNLLSDNNAKQNLVNQLVEEVKSAGIDGVALDFEPQQSFSTENTQAFNDFVSNLTNQMHAAVPNSEVAVAIPSSGNNNLFDLRSLANRADRILVMAYNFAAPEVKDGKPVTPVFGASNSQYWSQVNGALNNLQAMVPSNKLVLERAWYGNGDNYPLYTPNLDQTGTSQNKPATSVQLDQATLDRLVANVPAPAQAAARQNIPIIAAALDHEGILNSNVLAYALATIEHETDSTFQPIEEIQGRFSARRLGYEGGTDYFGRGFIQLTHLRNYLAIGQRIGMGDQLAAHPELASTPEVAAKILAAFFKDNNVANLASAGDFIDARAPVNPDRNAYHIAALAWKYE